MFDVQYQYLSGCAYPGSAFKLFSVPLLCYLTLHGKTFLEKNS